LVRTETPYAKAKAAKILSDLSYGADFATAARERSEDPGSAAEGGALGYFAKGRMVAPFQEALDKLQKEGDLSDVVETRFGYHIIQLLGRRPAGVRTFEQVREPLMKEIEAKLINDARTAEIQRIKDAAQFDKAAIEAFSASQK
jgi:peptidyl-prolyl cis-trans isomerase C